VPPAPGDVVRNELRNELTEMIRRTPLPLALLDLASNRLTLVNAPFAALIKVEASQAEGLDFLSMLPAEDLAVAERVLAGVASGIIDSCQGQGRWHSPQGDAVDVVASVRPLDASKPRTRALVAAAVATGTPTGEHWLAPDSKGMAFGAIDHDWHISEISADAAELLGWDPEDSRGTPLQTLVHPDDVSLLLLTLGRSGAVRRAAVTRLRVRGVGGDWSPVRLAVSPLCNHNPPRFSVAFGLTTPGNSESSDDRANRLEGHLWRIAVEVQSAGVSDLSEAGQGWWADPMLRGLSRRQSEILRRLTRGQRVPAIARELFVSPSTVRNHLSAIYRRLGVHSQSELLARLMPAVDPSRGGQGGAASFRDG
jgi:DNA-binding CsgD family transcriptional regulator